MNIQKPLVMFSVFLFAALCFLQNGKAQTQPWSSQAYYGNYNQYSRGMIWDDRVMQRQMELTKAQRRELIEIKIDYDDEVGDLQLKVQKLTAKQYTYKPNGGYEVNKEVQKQIQDFQKQIGKLNTEFRARADDVLLPHQREIRSKINLKKAVNRGFILQLSGGGFDRHLNISPEQKKKILAKKKELDQKLKEKVADLLDEMKENLVRELDSEQRDLVRELLEDYEYRVDKNTYSILNYESYYFKRKKTAKE